MWTEEMTAICFGMKRAGMTNKAIAARLGVTERAVRDKCMRKAHKGLTNKNGGGTRKSRILAGVCTPETTEDL